MDLVRFAWWYTLLKPPAPLHVAQGSLLLGTVTRVALGEDVLSSPQALISPLTIAGWCGLLTTALNMLPVGKLDGGRMMQVRGWVTWVQWWCGWVDGWVGGMHSAFIVGRC